jgi:hypothetical protein
MFSKTIKYKNFADEDCLQEFYFHLGKAEIIELGVANIHGRLQRIKNTQNGPEILKEIRELVRMAAGIRSDDGKRFIKDSEAKSALFDSNAYDELLFELATDAESASEFVNKLFPQDLLNEMIKHMKGEEKPTVVDGTTVSLDERHEKMRFRDALDAQQQAAEDNSPAWIREKRKPTKAELMRMPREEMFEAFRQYPGLSQEKLTDA